MAEGKSGGFKQSFKGTFGKIFARTDIPIKVKQNPGHTVKTKNIVVVSGSKTWKAKAENAAQLNYSSTLPPKPSQQGVNLDFHVDPATASAATTPRSQQAAPVWNTQNGDVRLQDGNNNSKSQHSGNQAQQQHGNSAMSAKYIQGTHPDVKYFQQQAKQADVTSQEAVTSSRQESPRGRKLERRESERVWNAYSKDKNTYRHQYFIQKTKNLEDDEEVIALMNREPSPVRVDVNPSPPPRLGPHSPPRRQQSRQSVLDQLSPAFQKQLSSMLGGGGDGGDEKTADYSTVQKDSKRIPPPPQVPVPAPPVPPGGVPAPPPVPGAWGSGVTSQDIASNSQASLTVNSTTQDVDKIYEAVKEKPTLTPLVIQHDAETNTGGTLAGAKNLQQLRVNHVDGNALPYALNVQTSQHAHVMSQISPGSVASNTSTIRMFMQSSPTSIYSPASAALTPTYSPSGALVTSCRRLYTVLLHVFALLCC